MSNQIKEAAANRGFIACGIAKAEYLEKYGEAYDKWLDKGYQADMHYMENYREKRKDPRKLVDGAQSVISVLYNYYPEQELPEEGNYKLSRYAYGKDYHFVVKDYLKALLADIETLAGPQNARVFIDTAPVMDRAWAELAGIGWIGKNSMLINRKYGSYVFVGEIITDLPLAYDTPMNNLCGGCTLCLQACPTEAIIKDGVIDSNKCISYWTIENKTDQIPEALRDKFEDNIFGCDICQEVCPWNRFSKPHREPQFHPHPSLLAMDKQAWQNLTQEQYRTYFKKSAVKRAKYSGLKRNINFTAR
ncbi:MAG: tRNA epoxyqueuosine(34) reductase QueG [Bacteroidales bacterium]|nr:tRNA epoxyqueuosine(34) reductase QueG [Bacteroidales bacterium]